VKSEIELMEVLFFNLSLEFLLVMKIRKFYKAAGAKSGNPASAGLLVPFVFSI
jgi:hypothetical protein